MSIRYIAITGVVATALAIAPVALTAQQQTKPVPPPQETPAPAKAPAAVAGKWNVVVTTANGPLESALDLKADPKDAKKITGTIASQMGEAPLTGTFVDGKLMFAFSMDANGSTLNVTFNGTLQKDGSLAGMFDFGQGEMPWTATRAK